MSGKNDLSNYIDIPCNMCIHLANIHDRVQHGTQLVFYTHKECTWIRRYSLQKIETDGRMLCYKRTSNNTNSTCWTMDCSKRHHCLV
jgi:predicted MarR family transcription regulator